jgi:RNA polymerase sigma-70 factor (ECF subfamily)
MVIRLLPPKQRTVLILADALGWTASEIATLLETAVNSTLHRARATLHKHRPPSRLEFAPRGDTSEQERALLKRFIEANEQADAAAIVAMLHEELRFAMPPEPGTYQGRETYAQMLQGAFAPPTGGEWRGLSTWTNRQPAAAAYLRKTGETEFRLCAIDVLRIVDGEIVELVPFFLPYLAEPFGPPPTL